MDLDIVVCEKSKKIDCDNANTETTKNTTTTQHNKQNEIICQSDTVVMCSQKPKLVTVTLKKQPCGKDPRPRITKICITDNKNANYTCKNLLEHTNGSGGGGTITCDENNITKEIITEALPDRHSALIFTKMCNLRKPPLNLSEE